MHFNILFATYFVTMLVKLTLYLKPVDDTELKLVGQLNELTLKLYEVILFPFRNGVTPKDDFNAGP